MKVISIFATRSPPHRRENGKFIASRVTKQFAKPIFLSYHFHFTENRRKTRRRRTRNSQRVAESCLINVTPGRSFYSAEKFFINFLFQKRTQRARRRSSDGDWKVSRRKASLTILLSRNNIKIHLIFITRRNRFCSRWIRWMVRGVGRAKHRGTQELLSLRLKLNGFRKVTEQSEKPQQNQAVEMFFASFAVPSHPKIRYFSSPFDSIFIFECGVVVGMSVYTERENSFISRHAHRHRERWKHQHSQSRNFGGKHQRFPSQCFWTPIVEMLVNARSAWWRNSFPSEWKILKIFSTRHHPAREENSSSTYHLDDFVLFFFILRPEPEIFVRERDEPSGFSTLWSPPRARCVSTKGGWKIEQVVGAFSDTTNNRANMLWRCARLNVCCSLLSSWMIVVVWVASGEKAVKQTNYCC